MVDYIELDELDNALEATISKYEDKVYNRVQG